MGSMPAGTTRSRSRGQLAAALFALTALATLAGCDNRASDRTAGEKLDQAIAKTGDTAAAAASKAGELAERARDNTKEYLDSPKVKEDVAAVKEAIKDAGSAVKETTSDAALTGSVSAELARDPELSARKIDVDTRNGAVRLSGPAPTAEAKARAETIAKAVKGVASVDNQLVVEASAAAK
ncbi:BON domain-containing protein [Burkholderiales bacterium 8X]|nr:BON domain-containing protein [Burkholderiales bacterium 8X]